MPYTIPKTHQSHNQLIIIDDLKTKCQFYEMHVGCNLLINQPLYLKETITVSEVFFLE